MQGNAPPVLFPTEGSLGGKRKVTWSWREEGRRSWCHQRGCPGCPSGRAGKQVWSFGMAAGHWKQLLGGFVAIYLAQLLLLLLLKLCLGLHMLLPQNTKHTPWQCGFV